MVQLQILNRVLTDKSLDLILSNNLSDEYFVEYEPEYQFIKSHYENYKCVPDVETLVAQFPEFDIIEVNETDRYLIDTIREEYLYSKSVPVIKKTAELLKVDSNEAARYLQSELVNLTPNYTTPFVDITKSRSRLNTFNDKANNKDQWYIPTGFPELDDIIGGWQCGEEFVVLFARTGQGKSWVLVKSMQHAWSIGKNVGYISPEMSADKIGYRFDTLQNNFSNVSLLRGDKSNISDEEYNEYFKTLESRDNKFLVSTPRDFNNKVTVSKLKTFVETNKLDVLAIDGISYMTDDRYKRGDNKTTTLTNISEDLMSLSCELKIPIIVVVQSNREGVRGDEDGTPDIENIRDSDGISHNATKVISLKQKDEGLLIQIKKHRDGAVGGKLTYLWDIDLGKFQWLPSDNDTASEEHKRERKQAIKQEFKQEGKVVF